MGLFFIVPAKDPFPEIRELISNQITVLGKIYLLICFSLLIDLDTLIIMSPKIDALYLRIRPLGLVPFNLAYGLL